MRARVMQRHLDVMEVMEGEGNVEEGCKFELVAEMSRFRQKRPSLLQTPASSARKPNCFNWKLAMVFARRFEQRLLGARSSNTGGSTWCTTLERMGFSSLEEAESC